MPPPNTMTDSAPLLIERIAEMRPDHVALRSANEEVTYSDLNRRASSFASYLVAQGVGREDVVAVCFDRSAQWIIAALGILRAGAAYLPVDIDQPEAYLHHVLTDSGAKAIVCRTALGDRLGLAIRVIDPIRDAKEIAGSRPVEQDRSRGEDLAYLIYTSGSSGAPKAVEITHSNLSGLVHWHGAAFGVDYRDCASHLATLGFDAAVWEIWPNLSAGATVCIPNERVRTSPTLVKDWILREKITIAFVPTFYASSLMTMQWPSHSSLRLLLTGADTLQKSPPAGLPFRVYNNYGPTECTVVATSCELAPSSEETPPIGWGRDGANIYLLDDQKQPVADAACGEIYIGGACVGRGYRNLPVLTADSFVPDPFVSEPGHKMFRTGDLGMRQADGQFRFLGRVDRQVKINGKRAELDEIAAVLARHPSVEFAAVVMEEATDGRKQLVAYLQIKKGDTEPGAKEFRTYLLKRLPQFMVPEIFHGVNEAPLSPNGKVDLAALSTISAAKGISPSNGRLSSHSIENELLSLIHDLLKDDSVGAKDEFFLVGGDSLFAMQLILSVRSSFGVDLIFDEVFEAGTVESLARVIEANRKIAAPNVLTKSGKRAAEAVNSQNAKAPVYWIRPAPAFLRVAEPNHSIAPVMIGLEDIDQLSADSSLEKIAARFVAKLIEANPAHPYCLGGFCRNALLAYEVANQLHAMGRPTPALLLIDCPGPVSLRLADPFAGRLGNVGYLMKRAAKAGPAAAFSKIRDRIGAVCALRPQPKVRLGALEMLEEIIEGAIARYRPGPFEGRALLVLATDRAAHLDLAGEWSELIRSMSVEYVEGHHDDLLNEPQLRETLIKMSSYLESIHTSDEHVVS